MTMTLTEVLGQHDITPADELLADIEVPVLTGPQRQGDVFIAPRPRLGTAERSGYMLVPPEGIAVVQGEATGNTHLLTAADGIVLWSAAPPSTSDMTLGVCHVDDGAVAYLIHTDEHGANGMGPGTYVLTGKREQAAEIQRVAD